MFNFIPFAGARRKVTNMKRQLQFIRQVLQRDLPESVATAVAATAVGRNHQFGGARKSLTPHFTPPAAYAGRGEACRIMIDANTHPAFVTGQIVYAIGNGLAE